MTMDRYDPITGFERPQGNHVMISSADAEFWDWCSANRTTIDYARAHPDLMAGLVADPPTMVVVPVAVLRPFVEYVRLNLGHLQDEFRVTDLAYAPYQITVGELRRLALAATPTAAEKGGG